MTTNAFICSCAGTALAADEVRFFKDAAPWGLILFARNVETPGQVSELVEEFRSAVGWHAPVLIDQEGGRVQRLRPPNWPEFPPAARYGALYVQDPELGLEACRLGARLIGEELNRIGIDCDCLPVLDLAHPGRHAVIGDRAYSGDPEIVAALGRAACEGLLEAGVLPVIKHIPGHGRAAADSHVELPRVDAGLDELQATDFIPFRRLNDMPMAMTAHILFTALDAERPATLSADIIDGVIRGKIGFDGLLMSDDVSMKALAGSIGDRCEGLFAAGCDLALHCNGEMDEMLEVASASPGLAGRAAERAEAAVKRLRPPRAIEVAEARGRLDALMGGIA